MGYNPQQNRRQFMGKKKSVVLMVILSVIIAVLCAITVFPSFAVPGTVKIWNPAVMQYDLSTDLGGGYYAYYYPEGVISESEYNDSYADDEAKGKAEYQKIGNLYFSKNESLGILENGKLSEEFKTEFQALAAEMDKRVSDLQYSSSRVSVVNGYSIKVEIPKSDVNYATTFEYLSYTGAMDLQVGGETIDALTEKDVTAKDLIDSFKVKTESKIVFIDVKMTEKGKEAIASIKDTLTSTSEASSGEAKTFDILIGENKILSIYSDHVIQDNLLTVGLAYEEGVSAVKTLGAILNSTLKSGGFDIEFAEVSNEIREFKPVYGEEVLTLLYIAVLVVLVACIVLPIVFFGRYGIVNMYSTLSYLIVTGLCFAFISGGIFEVSLGTVAVFLLGLLLVNFLNAHIYNAIRKEFYNGKTAESAVKNGYNSTLFHVVDIYAVLLIGALIFLSAIGGLFTVTLQAIICIVTGAFCNLLWSRAINYVFLSASADKHKYFRFVREDEDDE